MERDTRRQRVSPWPGVLLIATFAIAPTAGARTASCPVPDPVTEADKLACVKAARIFVAQPTLTLEQVLAGPDAPHGRAFDPSAEVLCYFRPHYAFRAIPGRSKKFRCWRLTPERDFLSKQGEPMQIEGPHIEYKQNDEGETRARLVDADGKRHKPDQIKVKYLRPPHPEHDRRYHEVFTEAAVTRIFWVLGLPADGVYPVEAASCVGCDEDPFRWVLRVFRSGQKENTAAPTDAPRRFAMAAIERKLDFPSIETEENEYWRWTDAARFYEDGTWDDQQRAEYDAYRLALGLVFYHNDKEQQNRVACREDFEESNGRELCREPVILVQDVGSTFGRKKFPLFFWTANPRGEYRHWQGQTVFRSPEGCELRAPLAGPHEVSREGQALLAERLERLDRATVEAIFRNARFDRMDQVQLDRLRGEGTSDPGAAAVAEWTDTFMERIAEVRSERGCPPL